MGTRNKDLILLKRLAIEKNDYLQRIANKLVGEQDAGDIVNTALSYLLARCQDKEGKYKKIERMGIELLVQTVKSRGLDLIRSRKRQEIVMDNSVLNSLKKYRLKF